MWGAGVETPWDKVSEVKKVWRKYWKANKQMLILQYGTDLAAPSQHTQKDVKTTVLTFTIADYPSKWNADLPLVEEDARIIKEISEKAKCERIIQFKNGQCTKARILNEIASLDSLCAPNESIVIYFSGHGSTLDNRNSIILPYDFSTINGQWDNVITNMELVMALANLRKQDPNRTVCVILDSCFSAGMVSERDIKKRIKTFKPSPLEPGEMPLKPFNIDEIYTTGIIYLTASRHDYPSYDGAFTPSLQTAFEKTNYNIKYVKAIKLTGKDLRKREFYQIPQFLASPGFKNAGLRGFYKGRRK